MFRDESSGRTRTWGSGDEAAWVPGWTVEGRYDLKDPLGAGAFGTVFAAYDRITQRQVAIKAFLQYRECRPRRFGREVRALETLQLPGVVRILDQGAAAGIHYIVMERILGQAFPGRHLPLDWEELSPLAIALLETISRVHAAGLVHRDLKPNNILVDSDGVLTILDFGLAWGTDLESQVTREGVMVGTPQYLAPEQTGGVQVDLRADLYAFGGILYECLCGEVPYQGETLEQLLLAKSRSRPEPLHKRDARIPERISDLIGRLLDPSPHRRPNAAAEILRIFRGESIPREDAPAIWLGSTSPLDLLRGAFERNRSIDICGVHGSGRSRCLEEAARIAHRLGRAVHWVTPAQSPFASLQTVGGSGPLDANSSLEETAAAITRKLREKLADGAVLLVDELEGTDRWTRSVLEELRPDGCVIRALTPPLRGEIELEPLSQSDLSDLFWGPDRVFHLREDAGRQLHLRTDGNPELVVEELQAWKRSGLCRVDGERWRISRESLDQLAVGFEFAAGLRIGIALTPLNRDEQKILAWIELAYPRATTDVLVDVLDLPRWEVEASLEELCARRMIRKLEDQSWAPIVTGQSILFFPAEDRKSAHARLAQILPHGMSRLFHLIAGHSTEAAFQEEVIAETLEIVDDLECNGRLGEAIAAVSRALDMVRENGEEGREEELIRAWSRLAFSSGSRSTVERLIRVVQRNERTAGALENIRALLSAHLDALSGQGREALEALRQIPELNPSLELWRLASQMIAARSLSLEEEERILCEVESAFRALDLPGKSQNMPSWRGRLLYRQGRFAEAAEHYIASLGAPRPSAQISAALNACSALVEGGDLDRAAEFAGTAHRLAVQHRHSSHELRADHQLRNIAYHRHEFGPPDLEGPELAERLGVPSLGAMVCLTEAGFAWRAANNALCRDFATRAHELWRGARHDLAAAFAHLVTGLAGADISREECESDWKTVSECPHPGLKLQALAILDHLGCPVPRARETALEHYGETSPGIRGMPREIFSPDECLERLGLKEGG